MGEVRFMRPPMPELWDTAEDDVVCRRQVVAEGKEEGGRGVNGKGEGCCTAKLLIVKPVASETVHKSGQ